MAVTGVAYAVVRDDPPQVYLADDIDTLQRVIAVEVVARTEPGRLSTDQRDELRRWLLDEAWGEAVLAWIGHTGIEVDVYTHAPIWADDDLPADLVGARLQFSSLFRD